MLRIIPSAMRSRQNARAHPAVQRNVCAALCRPPDAGQGLRPRHALPSLAMFLIELSYIAPLSEIDAAMKDHVAFLEQGYAAGLFLISGRKVPRDGGIILALGPDRAQVEALMQRDP